MYCEYFCYPCLRLYLIVFYSAHYDDVEEADQRVKTFWEALTRFSNEDRSRFLRFVTGRRRLPAPLIIYCEKGWEHQVILSITTVHLAFLFEFILGMKKCVMECELKNDYITGPLIQVANIKFDSYLIW